MRKSIRVSDAIPKMPVSFEQTVERTLNSVCKEQKSSARAKERTAENRWVPTGESVRTSKKTPKIRQIFAYCTVAVLLVAIVGIGAFVLRNALYNGRQTELSHGMTEQTELPKDDATLQNDVSYYFLVDGEPVYPFEGFAWESKPGLEADGAGVRIEDEKVRSQIPATEYSAGMPFAVLTADGWKMDEIIVFDAAYERIADVAGSGIPKEEGSVYVVTDLLNTLSPGTYYVSAIVSYRTENYSRGNEIAICLHVGTGAGEPSTTDAPILQPEPSLLPTPFASQSPSDPSSTQPPKDADEPQTYVTWSAALTGLLRTEDPDAVLNISIIAITYNEEDDLGFLYQGKSLTEYREEPALAAYWEAYDLWYFTVYPAVDEQNRGTPGWEKHDPGALFDAYWRERHTDAEIRAYEQAAEAYGEAKNALRSWRDSTAGKDAVRAFLQQECDRLNACGFRLQLVRVEDTQSYRLDGTATVEQLRAFPARDVTHFYWITLYNDDSPIDE